MNQDIFKTKSLNEFFEKSFKKYWDFKALTDFHGGTLLPSSGTPYKNDPYRTLRNAG